MTCKTGLTEILELFTTSPNILIDSIASIIQIFRKNPISFSTVKEIVCRSSCNRAESDVYKNICRARNSYKIREFVFKAKSLLHLMNYFPRIKCNRICAHQFEFCVKPFDLDGHIASNVIWFTTCHMR